MKLSIEGPEENIEHAFDIVHSSACVVEDHGTEEEIEASDKSYEIFRIAVNESSDVEADTLDLEGVMDLEISITGSEDEIQEFLKGFKILIKVLSNLNDEVPCYDYEHPKEELEKLLSILEKSKEEALSS